MIGRRIIAEYNPFNPKRMLFSTHARTHIADATNFAGIELNRECVCRVTKTIISHRRYYAIKYAQKLHFHIRYYGVNIEMFVCALELFIRADCFEQPLFAILTSSLNPKHMTLNTQPMILGARMLFTSNKFFRRTCKILAAIYSIVLHNFRPK